jgi:hypothetical protein
MITNTTELLLETVFCTLSMQSAYKKKKIGVTSEFTSAREAEKRWSYS